MISMSRRTLLALSAGVGVAAAVRAETYPSKRIEMLIPFAAGGVIDVLGRVVAEPMSRELGQPVIVKNVAGAGGTLAYGQLAKAKADGYTVGVIGSGLNINAVLRPELGFDAPGTFRPLGYLGSQSFALFVNPAVLDVKSVGELIDQVRKQPGKLFYSSGGIGASSHILMEYLKNLQNMDVVHAPYSGQARSINALLSADVAMTLQPVTGVEDLIRAGKLRPLVCTGTSRMKVFPDVPNFHEAGISGMEASGWMGLAAPGGLPDALAARIIEAWNKSVAHPDLQRAMESRSVDTALVNDSQFARMIVEDRQRWKRAIAVAKVTAAA